MATYPVASDCNTTLGRHAMEIAKSTGEILGHHVIITDIYGIVVGASDESRLGVLHEASLEVLQHGHGSVTTEEEAQKLQGTLPGVTYPINSMSGVMMGTMAITGDAKAVRPFALIVKKQIEILLKERELCEHAMNRESMLQSFIQDLSRFVPGVTNEAMLLARALEFGYDRTWYYIPIAVDLYQFARFAVSVRQSFYQQKGESPESVIQNIKRKVLLEMRKVFPHSRDIVAMESNNHFVIFHGVRSGRETLESGEVQPEIKEKSEKILGKLVTQGLTAAVGIGSPSLGIGGLAGAYREAWKALGLGKKFCQGPGVYSIGDYRLEEMVAAIAPGVRNRFVLSHTRELRNQGDWEELKETVKKWCECNFSLVKTAQELHVHRNTVIYRLEKIGRVSGVDMRDFRTCFNLYMALVLDHYAGPGAKE